jgi:protein associated with RNAse G/E
MTSENRLSSDSLLGPGWKQVTNEEWAAIDDDEYEEEEEEVSASSDLDRVIIIRSLRLDDPYRST